MAGSGRMMSKAWLWLTLGKLFSPTPGLSKDLCVQLSQEEWQSVAVFALNNLVAPELFYRLTELGAMDLLSKDVAEGLEGAAELNALAHDDLRTIFADFTAIANGLGIVPIMLKGGIDVVSPDDAVNVSRMVSDLDLLVNEEEAPRLYDALLASSFRTDLNHPDAFDPDGWTGHHYPPLWHPTLNQYIELHTCLGPSESDDHLLNELKETCLERRQSGFVFLVPSIESRLVHNSVHHFIRNIGLDLQSRSFRQALDFSRLSERYANQNSSERPLDSLSENPRTASVLRSNTIFSNDIFVTKLAHTAPTAAEAHAEDYFWKRMNSGLLEKIHDTIAFFVILGRRLFRNPVKWISLSFYQRKFRMIKRNFSSW